MTDTEPHRRRRRGPGRPENPERMRSSSIRLHDAQWARIMQQLRPGERPADLIRAAIEAELDRREAAR